MAPGLLKPNAYNSNYVPPENEAKLLESVERFGVYKPIVCRELADGTLEIIGGEHRARTAERAGIELVPVVNLGRIDDKKAKAISLADNGRYGEDDPTKLAEILLDLGDDAELYLPFDESDLAGIFAAKDIAFDDLDMPTDAKSASLEELLDAKPTMTHQLMRFKVPLEDAGRIQELFDRVIKTRGYSKDSDSLAAAGMALVDVVNAAREHF